MKRKRVPEDSVSSVQSKVHHDDRNMLEIHRRTTQLVMDAARRQFSHDEPPAAHTQRQQLQLQQQQPQLSQYPQLPATQLDFDNLGTQQILPGALPVSVESVSKFRDISSFFTSPSRGGQAPPTHQVSLPPEGIGCWVCGISISYSLPLECQGCTRKICRNCQRQCCQCLLQFCSCCAVCE